MSGIIKIVNKFNHETYKTRMKETKEDITNGKRFHVPALGEFPWEYVLSVHLREGLSSFNFLSEDKAPKSTVGN